MLRIIRWILGLVLLFAGLMKLISFDDFVLSLSQYRWLTNSMFLKSVAAGIVALEGTVGVLMLVGKWKKVTILIATILFAIFLLVSVLGVVSGTDVSCGCFGGVRLLDATPWQAFIRNSILFVLSIGIAQNEKSSSSKIKYSGSFLALSSTAVIAIVLYRIQPTDFPRDVPEKLPEAVINRIENQFSNFEQTKIEIKNGSPTAFIEIVGRSELTVVFIFTSANCMACVALVDDLIAEIPLLNARSKRVQLFGIARHTSWSSVENYISMIGLETPIYAFSGTGSGSRTVSFQTPVLFIFDSSGQILYNRIMDSRPKYKVKLMTEVRRYVDGLR